MNGTNALGYRHAAKSDVLAWLNADYRLRAGIDPEVDSGETLLPETTIAEWRSICDLVSTRRLSSIMHEWFEVVRPLSEWEGILEPEDERTLGDLARFVAPYMRLPEFRPIRIGGVSDAASGAFFCLRTLLVREGVPAVQIRPSTQITSLDSAFIPALGNALAKLAPDISPEPRIVSYPRQRVGGAFALLGFLLLISSTIWTWATITVVAVVLILAGAVLTAGPPASVEFGSYSTFGDLARAIASSRQAAT